MMVSCGDAVLQQPTILGSLAAQRLVDAGDVDVDRWLPCRRWGRRADRCGIQRRLESLGQSGGITHAVNVGPPHRRVLLQQMLVQCGLGDTMRLQRIGDLGQLLLGDHEVAHQQRFVVVVSGECRVPAQRQPWFDVHTVGRDVKVIARQVDPIRGVVVSELAATSQRVGHRLPVGIGGGHRRTSFAGVAAARSTLGARTARRQYHRRRGGDRDDSPSMFGARHARSLHPLHPRRGWQFG